MNGGLGATPMHLKAIRLSVLSIWLWIVVSTPYEAYALLPNWLIRGVGVGGSLLGFDSVRAFLFTPTTLWCLRWGAAAAILFALLRPSQLLVICIFCVIALLDVLTKSIGAYPNHAQFAPLATLFIVAAFTNPTLERQGVAAETTERRAAVIWLLALVLAMPYTFIGLNRMLEGGPSLFLGDALPRYLTYTRELYSVYPFGLPASVAELRWVEALVKCGFAVTTVFEMSAPAVLFSKRWRTIWLPYMCGFHVATLFLMNIFFWEQLVLIIVVFGWNLRSEVAQSVSRPASPLVAT